MAEFTKLEFSQDWGGFHDGEHERAATGAEVQYFIKNSKVGYTHVLKNQEDSNGDKNHILLGFADVTTYEAWEQEKSNATTEEQKVAIDDTYIISTAKIPAAQPEAGYLIKFQSKTDRNIISTEGRVILECRFNTFMYDPSTNTTEYMVETGTVNIYKQLGSNGFELVNHQLIKIDGKSNKSSIDSINPADTTTYNSIDVTDALNEGNQDIKIEIVGQTSGLVTSYTYKINNARIGLKFANKNWIQNVIDETNPSMGLFFDISGNIEKRLHVNISIGKENGETKFLKFTSYPGKDPVNNYPVPGLTDSRLFSHGIHDIEAWIEIPGTTNRSNTIKAQILIVSDKGNNSPYVIVNNIKDPIENWVNQNFFDYAVYAPNATTLPVSIVMTDLDETIEYLVTPYMSKNVGEIVSYRNTLSINNSTPEFSIKSKIRAEYNGEESTLWEQKLLVKSGAYAPTTGSTFSIDPSNRYNDEQDPRKIINASNPGMKLECVWSDNMLFNNVSGWIGVENEYGIYKCLHLLSGQQLDVKYNPFESWVKEQSNTPFGAFEFDFAVNNIYNQYTPLIRICKTGTLGNIEYPIGIELRGLDAMVGLTNKGNRLEQDIAFQEGVRTHVMITYSNNLIKVYINGCLTRIIDYANVTNIYPVENEPFYMKFGNTEPGADISLYNLRIYEGIDLTDNDVFQNYISTLPTTDSKDLLFAKNDIFDENGNLSYDLVKTKYNTMVWESLDGKESATLAKYGNTEDDKYPGNLRINIIGDSQRSGLITNLRVKGQGTSSMNYYRWNQRWEFDKLDNPTNFISDAGSDYNTEGCYQLYEGMPYAQRLDGKINWASSMQSHKMGSCDLYNDLWKYVVTNNTITSTPGGDEFTGTSNGYADCRVSIKQLPFFLFVDTFNEEEGKVVKEFAGLYTMGPSKGDKPTFGYDKKAFPNFVMMEGCNNDEPLIMCSVPWNDQDVKFKEAAGSDEDIYYYLSEKTVNPETGEEKESYKEQWEVSMGDVDKFTEKNSNGVSVYDVFKEMSNFIYSCNPYLNPIKSYEDLVKAEDTYKDEFYWIQTDDSKRGYKKYELFRYDSYIKDWVRAGIEHVDGGDRSSNYLPVNLADGVDFTPENYSTAELNKKFIDLRVQKFANGISKYIQTDDLRFTVQFLKLIAASDNWSKNTYLYTTGFKADGTFDPIRFFQDDMDTIFATNNVGYKTKVYYIEEHDGEDVQKNPNGVLASHAVPNQSYWVSSKNALYTLAEKALNMKEMLYSILNGCAHLSEAENCTTDEAILECFKKYYFNKVADAFPIKAYNEISKMYIAAHNDVNYNATAAPLAQVTGNAIEGETQWMKQRLIYLSSYAEFGIFNQGDGKGGSGGFAFRTPDAPWAGNTFNLQLTPSMWLYPSVDIAGNSIMASRTAPNTPTKLGISATANKTFVIRGLDYLYSMGDLTTLATDANSLSIFGEKMKDFTITGNTLFQPLGLSFAKIPNMENINLSGSNGLKNIVNISIDNNTPRLKYIDLTGTSINDITLPPNSNIVELKLPDTISSLNIDGLKLLTNDNFKLNDYSKLKQLTIKNMGDDFDLYSIVAECVEKGSLTKLDINNLNWDNMTVAMLNKILNIQNCNIAGVIKMGKSEDVDFDLKMKLIDKFGNIDDPNNSLYVDYTKKELASANYVEILGINNVYKNGKYYFSLKYPAPGGSTSANDFTSIIWSVSDSRYCSIDNSGVLNYIGGEIEGQTITIRCTVVGPKTPENGLVKEKTIYLYPRLARVGDYVYADGTYASPEEHFNREDIVATCFYVDGSSDVKSQKRLAAAQELLTPNYGYYGETKRVAGITNRSYSGVSDSTRYILTTSDIEDLNNTPNNTTAIGDFGWTDGKPRGKNYTDYIIKQRGESIKNSMLIDPDDPSNDKTLEELLNSIDEISLRLKYYPAASYCIKYQPNIDGLSDMFKKGKWFLPSAGELSYLWYAVVKDQEYPSFTNLKNQFHTNVPTWSSSTYSEILAWAIIFKYGSSAWGNSCIGGGQPTINGTGLGQKSALYSIIPVVDFSASNE